MPGPPVPDAPEPRPAVPPGFLSCPRCRHTNPFERKFCASCGRALVEPCFKCGTPTRPGERFCGECGADLGAVHDSRIAAATADLEKGQRRRAEFLFDEAISLWRRVAAERDPRLDEYSRQAARLIEEVEAERARREAEAAAALERGRRLAATHNYDSAAGILGEVPPALRSPELESLLEEVEARRREIMLLAGEIREALESQRTLELMPKLERMLALQPKHAKAEELLLKIRDRVTAAAKKRVGLFKFDEALDLLRRIPPQARTSESEDLTRQAEELAWLDGSLRKAPTVDPVLAAAAQRYVQLAPGHAPAAKLLEQVQQRAKLAPKDPRFPAPPWAAPPKNTLLGCSVDAWSGFGRLAPKKGAEAPAIAQRPNSFFVAAGLALQGLEQAHVATNLLPEAPKGVLGRLGLGLGRKKPPRAAWGLDLSETALKAVRLTSSEDGGEVRLDACEYLPHSKPLTQPDSEGERSEILAHTLRRFLERQPLAQEKLCASLAGSRLLGRFVSVPPVEDKQLSTLVEYEARSQMPFALEELYWDYHVLTPEADQDEDEDDEDAGRPRQCVLVAAKDYHVDERVKLFEGLGLKLDVLQHDCVALHNCVVYEFFGGAGAEPAGQALALLDVGADASNLVISSPDSLWFRSLRLGGDDFSKALVRAFQLTFADAEKLKQRPETHPRFSPVYRAMEPVFRELGSELERSLTAYAKVYPQPKVGRLLGVGGGFGLHGLHRYLWFGAQDEFFAMQE